MGFGLCFLYLRNIKGFKWNHKRVYRIYRELELNLRIKPRKRLVRERPEPLAVPEQPNQTWSMCQSARNVDPLSASNFHPPVVDQRLACPALAGVAEGRPSAGDEAFRL
jgi:hypothetical protein